MTHPDYAKGMMENLINSGGKKMKDRHIIMAQEDTDYFYATCPVCSFENRIYESKDDAVCKHFVGYDGLDFTFKKV